MADSIREHGGMLLYSTGYDTFVIKKCPACRGSGSITVLDPQGPTFEDPCKTCNQTGLVRIHLSDIPVLGEVR